MSPVLPRLPRRSILLGVAAILAVFVAPGVEPADAGPRIHAPRAIAAVAHAAHTAHKPRGWACWNQAANRYGVPATLLFAIAQTESRLRAGVVGHNTNGSYDVGLMQINSSWFPMLKRHYGITPQMLVSDPCLNLNVGAWILSGTLHRYGLNWKGVGAYNAGTPALQASYARQIAWRLRALAATQGASP